MSMLPVAVIVGAFAFGNHVSAQDTATPMNCALPDKTERAVNTTVAVDGRTYRCVDVLDEIFRRRGVAWTTKPTYTSEAMLRRIRGSADTTGADTMNCAGPVTEHPVNTTVTVEGRTYRCIAVLDQNFQRRGVAWTPVSPQP